MNKVCFKCNVAQPETNFYAHPRMKDGRLGKCKNCTKKDVASNYRSNITHYKNYDNQREDNPVRRELKIKYARTWRQSNREKKNYYTAMYRAQKHQACPSWVDKEAIKNIYRDCPTTMYVDHIIPLRGVDVCGLHVPWNLQYLLALDNIRKGNRIPF